MKLIQLDLEGFTSFRAPTTLRFDGLELFAICGPTGAGKSSLLDAITFALYGKVERLGAEIKSLKSAGAPSLGVQLEFIAGDTRFRVTRKLRATGAQKPLLERADGDGWIDAGDGADKVAGVAALIERALGIDYDGFVRTVILPQGQFARFLNGEPKERREILSKLLGLEIYGRMRQRADGLAADRKNEALAKQQMLERSLVDATPERLAETEGELRASQDSLDELERRRKLVGEIADRDTERATRTGALAAATGVVAAFRERADTLGARAAELEAEIAGSEPALATARAAADAARRTLEGFEARLNERLAIGGDAEVRAWRDAALELQRARTELNALAAAREKGVATITEAQSEETRLDRMLEDASAALEAARATLADAEHGLDAARRADHAAAACIGLSPGEPCPVCSAPLPDPLPVTAGDGLQRATETRDAARRALEAATAAQTRAAAELQQQRGLLERYRERLHEIEEQLAATRLQAEQGAARLAASPAAGADDPLAVLDGEISERESLRTALADARRDLDGAELRVTQLSEAGADRIRERDALATRLEEMRASLLPSVLQHVPDLAAPAEAIDADPASAIATALGARIATEQRAASELLDDARVVAELPAAGSISEVAGTLDGERRRLEGELGRLRGLRDTIAEQIERRAGLQAEVVELDASADRYRAVGEELKSNRFVEYLQHDALRGLCLAGNEHLLRLSGGRYRLHYEDGSFSVLDAWNADEMRSARTLSGGETFLASLSLALSLADEIARVRIGEGARLESLFLDEGFGTLDPETLVEVEEALDRLARTGRTIGIITHLKELAERLPVRIQVTKHPSGSTVELIA